MTRGIILSGGWGIRLRPLTCTIPKTLMPVVNKPVIERQMLLLKKAGVKEVVLAVSVLADFLKGYFKEGERLGIKVHYTDEKSPMGTAGAIKLAEDYLQGDNFFMLNGDVILNFDFKEMLDFHLKKKGLGTISSIMVDDPSRYGVLITDESNNLIKKFQEKSEYKPPEGRYVPMPINSGVYLLEPDVFSYIPAHRKVSIEKEVFPKLAEEKKIFHYPMTGIWKDIGRPEELLNGNIILMEDLIKNSNDNKNNLIDDSVDIKGRALIYPPVTIGANVSIGKDCIIGPNAIIGNNVTIGDNVEIKETLIYNENYISNKVRLNRTIISDNCNIEERVVAEGNYKALVILSSYVQVLKNVRIIVPIERDISISICHHEVVRESINY